MLTVLRYAAGPSLCQWLVDGLAEGEYDALIRRRNDTTIVAAAAEINVVRGGLSELRLESGRIDVEGRITINGLAPTDGALYVSAGSGPNRWTLPLDDDGRYSTTFPGGDSESFCVFFKRSRIGTIGLWQVDCRVFSPGAHRLDADLAIRGRIRVHVPPLGAERATEHASLQVIVTSLRRGQMSESDSFTAADGFSGEHFVRDYGAFDVAVRSRAAGQPELARTRITVSADNAEAHLTLVVP
jgi:hypothetical protein